MLLVGTLLLLNQIPGDNPSTIFTLKQISPDAIQSFIIVFTIYVKMSGDSKHICNYIQTYIKLKHLHEKQPSKFELVLAYQCSKVA